MRRGNSAK